ncbi:protein of unknown function (DUF4937) [Goodfellowiella coeruleoviolacea]|uniref:DUF4937 domain-containing protein n=1 Tax=Goodfellowiella coeruleoviolacea TaxID=334858 RepID=A0AAE3GDV9_9PSEU|nr:protein of unknown function (DUF4937) [Goodfellowiella coeruleoviolacea]
MKWIRCDVADSAGFDRGQQEWADLAGLPGFLGQLGGWSHDGSQVAHIFSFWVDQDAYEHFMSGAHDALAQRQVGTWSKIDVRLFERRADFGQSLAGTSGSGVLRLAHCVVKPDRVDHFAQVQKTVWNPGMSAAPGCLAGLFGQRGCQEFLVLTKWVSAAEHARYQAELFPSLRDRAVPSADLESITGHLVDLEPHWTVTAGDS